MWGPWLQSETLDTWKQIQGVDGNIPWEAHTHVYCSLLPSPLLMPVLKSMLKLLLKKLQFAVFRRKKNCGLEKAWLPRWHLPSHLVTWVDSWLASELPVDLLTSSPIKSSHTHFLRRVLCLQIYFGILRLLRHSGPGINLTSHHLHCKESSLIFQLRASCDCLVHR